MRSRTEREARRSKAEWHSKYEDLIPKYFDNPEYIIVHTPTKEEETKALDEELYTLRQLKKRYQPR